MSAGWKSNAAIVGAAVAGGLLAVTVYAFHRAAPTAIGVVLAYVVGVAVSGVGASILLSIVGKAHVWWSTKCADVSAMADPSPQHPATWREVRLSDWEVTP